MTDHDRERSKLRDIEPLAPAPDADDVEQQVKVNDVATAAAAGPAGIPAVGVMAEGAVASDDNPEVDEEARGGTTTRR
jgi:hypothetical protein